MPRDAIVAKIVPNASLLVWMPWSSSLSQCIMWWIAYDRSDMKWFLRFSVQRLWYLLWLPIISSMLWWLQPEFQLEKQNSSWVWWNSSVPAFGRLRQQNHEFKNSLEQKIGVSKGKLNCNLLILSQSTQVTAGLFVLGKPITQDYILYNSMCMTCPRQGMCSVGKLLSWHTQSPGFDL